MLAQVVLDNFEIGLTITILMAILGSFTGLIVYIFKSSTGQINQKTKDLDDKIKNIEKKMEPIPMITDKINALEKIDFSDFPTKEDMKELKDQMHELSIKIEEVSDESDSIVRDAPDKFQTRTQCTQNMHNIKEFLSTLKEEIKEQRREDLEQRKQDRLGIRDLNKKVDQILLKSAK